MDLVQTLKSFNAMLLAGDWRKCMETYYAENVEVFEGSMQVADSKQANISREEEFLKGVKAWNKTEILAEAAGENVTMTEWDMDFEHADYGHKVGRQVAVQHWKDGKVVREQYYALYA